MSTVCLPHMLSPNALYHLFIALMHYHHESKINTSTYHRLFTPSTGANDCVANYPGRLFGVGSGSADSRSECATKASVLDDGHQQEKPLIERRLSLWNPRDTHVRNHRIARRPANLLSSPRDHEQRKRSCRCLDHWCRASRVSVAIYPACPFPAPLGEI